MADSLRDLGVVTLWRPDCNWRETPDYGFDFERQLQEYEGTAHEVFSYSQTKPHRFNFLVSCFSKAAEYALLEKFNTLQGRFQRFWFLNPANLFTLAEPIDVDETGEIETVAITVVANDWEFLGRERIYLELSNGDVLTREITAYTPGADTAVLTVNTPLDRDIALDDVVLFSLVHLSRLENDALELTYPSKDVAETKIVVLEIPMEIEVPGVLAPILVIESATAICLDLTVIFSALSEPLPPVEDIVVKIWSEPVGGTITGTLVATRVDNQTITATAAASIEGWIEVWTNGVKATSVRFFTEIVACVVPLGPLTFSRSCMVVRITTEEGTREFDPGASYEVHMYGSLSGGGAPSVVFAAEYMNAHQIKFYLISTLPYPMSGYFEVVEDGIVISEPRISKIYEFDINVYAVANYRPEGNGRLSPLIRANDGYTNFKSYLSYRVLRYSDAECTALDLLQTYSAAQIDTHTLQFTVPDESGYFQHGGYFRIQQLRTSAPYDWFTICTPSLNATLYFVPYRLYLNFSVAGDTLDSGVCDCAYVDVQGLTPPYSYSRIYGLPNLDIVPVSGGFEVVYDDQYFPPSGRWFCSTLTGTYTWVAGLESVRNNIGETVTVSAV